MKVTNYRIYWDMTSNAGGIHLRLEDTSEVTLTADNPGKLVVWVDLLRNDTPVYYWKTDAGEGLSSNWLKVDPSDDGADGRYKQDGQA